MKIIKKLKTKQEYFLVSGMFFIVLLVSIFYIIRKGFDFDEAFNLQVSVKLSRNNQYGTLYYGSENFDPVITTGPTVLFPISIIFTIFGLGIIKARLVMVAYFLLFLISAYLFSKEYFKKQSWVSILFLFIILLMPRIFYHSLHVLGEIPALAFMFLGLLTIQKRNYFISGLLFGLSILTKFMMVLIIPSIILALLINFLIKEKPLILKYVYLIFGSFVPILFWNIYKLMSLGFIGYFDNLQAFNKILMFAALLANGSSMRSRIDALSVYIPQIPGLLILMFIFCSFVFFVVYKEKNNETITESELILLSYGLLSLFWWLFFSELDWLRHLLPGYIAFIFFELFLLLHGHLKISKWMENLSQIISCRNKLIYIRSIWFILRIICVILLFSILVSYQFELILEELNWTKLEQQQEVANDIILMNEINNILIGHYGWWQAPEMAFLTGMQFYDMNNAEHKSLFDDKVNDGGKILIIVDPVFKGHDPINAKMLLDKYEIVYEKYGYVLLDFNQ